MNVALSVANSPFEHTHTIKYLQSQQSQMSWITLTQCVFQLLKLPIDQRLEIQTTTIPKDSEAAKAGHENVGQFITSSIAESGLALDWDDWVRHALAYRVKKTYRINGVAQDRILSLYQKVTQHLKRRPIDAEDFHETKDALFNLEIRRFRNQFISKINQLEANAKVLNEAIKEKDSNFHKLKREQQFAQNDYQQYQDALAYERNKLESYYQSEIADLKSSYENQIKYLNQLSHNGQPPELLALKKKISNFKALIDSSREQLSNYQSTVTHYEQEIQNFKTLLDANSEALAHYEEEPYVHAKWLIVSAVAASLASLIFTLY